MGAKYTDAQKRAAEKYKAANREALRLDLPKGHKNKYKAYAQYKGQSLTALIVDLLDKDMTAADWNYEEEDAAVPDETPNAETPEAFSELDLKAEKEAEE